MKDPPNFCLWSQTLELTSHQAILQQYGSPLSPFSPVLCRASWEHSVGEQ